jgi:hypothetical protein
MGRRIVSSGRLRRNIRGKKVNIFNVWKFDAGAGNGMKYGRSIGRSVGLLRAGWLTTMGAKRVCWQPSIPLPPTTLPGQRNFEPFPKATSKTAVLPILRQRRNAMFKRRRFPDPEGLESRLAQEADSSAMRVGWKLRRT